MPEMNSTYNFTFSNVVACPQTLSGLRDRQKSSKFHDPRRIWRSLYQRDYIGNLLGKSATLWADLGPDISAHKNDIKNLVSQSHKPYWNMLYPEYEVLTPTGGLSGTGTKSKSKLTVFQETSGISTIWYNGIRLGNLLKTVNFDFDFVPVPERPPVGVRTSYSGYNMSQ